MRYPKPRADEHEAKLCKRDKQALFDKEEACQQTLKKVVRPRALRFTLEALAS